MANWTTLAYEVPWNEQRADPCTGMAPADARDLYLASRGPNNDLANDREVILQVLCDSR
jgi:hypothetical protein